MEKMNEILKKIDEKLEAGDYDQVKQLLEKLCNEGTVENVSYYWARLYNLTGNYEKTIEYLSALSGLDIKSKYELAVAYDQLDNVMEAEKCYLEILEENQDVQHQYSILCILGAFYRSHQMYLKMELIGKKLIEKRKDIYYGYHVCFRSYIERKRYNVAKAYLDVLDDNLKESMHYHMDYITYLEIEEKYQEIIAYLQDIEKRNYNKEFIYRYKIQIYLYLEEYDKAEVCLKQLVLESGKPDAIVSIAILMVSKGHYERAMALIRLALEEIKEDSKLFVYYAKLVEAVSVIMSNTMPEDERSEKYHKVMSEFNEIAGSLRVENKEINDLIDELYTKKVRK